MRLRMSNEDSWVTTRITEASKRHPLVTEAVSSRMEQLLKAQLSDRHLTTANLKSVAAELIKYMAPVLSKPEAAE